jgi:hypothetical protein
MGKDRDEKIVVGQPNNLEHIQRCGFRQFRDDRGGVKLTAFCVPGKTDIVKQRSNAAWQAEGPRDHFFNDRQNIGIKGTDGSKQDGRCRGRDQDGLFS